MDHEEFKIEKGIPIPPPTRKWHGRAKWMELLTRMEIGDSVVIPYVKLSSMYGACKMLRYKIRVQAQERRDDEDRMVRIWRLE